MKAISYRNVSIALSITLSLLGCEGDVKDATSAKNDASTGSDAATDSGSGANPDQDASTQHKDSSVGTDDSGNVNDDGSTTPEADGGSDAGDPQASWPPPGKVAMFVAFGSERTATSCDDGKTWQSFEKDASDSVYGGGIAFGDGVFVQVKGWGEQCTFLRSEDGVTWEHLSLAEVGLPGMSECAGVIYTGNRFTMMHSSGNAYGSTDGGKTFSLLGMFDNNSEHVREVAGGGPAPGILLAGGANDPGGITKNPPHVSVDGGKTWKATPGCSTLHAVSIAQEGGGALGDGRMVYVGYLGEVCTSNDMKTWHETQLPIGGMVRGKVSYDGDLFWAADREQVFVTKNGLDWTKRMLNDNIHLNYVAKSKKTWVGFDRSTSQFYRSTDGMTWGAADTSPVMAGDIFYRIVYGYGDPSATCPLP